MITGQKIIDPRDHLIPIQQQIHRNDGNNDKQHNDIQQRGRRLQRRTQQARAFFFDRIPHTRKCAPNGRIFVHNGRYIFGQNTLQLRKHDGGHVEQVRCLLHQGWNNDHGRDDKHDDCADCDHSRRGNARQSQCLKPVCNRIQKIGNRRPQNKRKQHIPQIPQNDCGHRNGDSPILGLLLNR